MMQKDNFKKFVTDDGEVAKYIHKDGSETSIKHSKTTQNILNPITNKIENKVNDRDKYTIFISTSKGCFMACKFCHLTMKGSSFKKLSNDNVLDNIKEAIKDSVERSPFLAKYYVKLSWMGMGDAFLDSEKVKEVSIELLDWILENKYAIGLDGVDLSTVYPKTNSLRWVKDFNDLNKKLQEYPLNPNNYKSDQANPKYSKLTTYENRSPFRLFYSIHSAVPENREKMIPNAKLAEEALDVLIKNCTEFNLIFHHMFLNKVNDSDLELEELFKLCKKHMPKHELRILRYNECNASLFYESDKFKEIIKELSKHVNLLKIQISPGTEVKAACGQFIVQEYVEIE
jgi:adenine C2-methylase RlmN of 23S rRNA A2503 and tRNA A37